MENESINTCRDDFMNYIQDTWMDGVYSPDMWSCFGRKSDFTNNAQESYKGVLNRLVQVAHPNVYSLIEYMVKELNYAEHNLGRISTGQVGRAPIKTKFVTIQEKTERMKALYIEGQFPGGTLSYLKNIGFFKS